MKNSSSDSFDDRSSRYVATENNRGTRLSEMYRRFKSLQAKRHHLRNELEAVEKYLASLDNQIKSFEQHEPMGFNR